jgi:hypothetical protein
MVANPEARARAARARAARTARRPATVLTRFNAARSSALQSRGLPYFSGYSFRHRNRVLRGITEALRARFWPDYSLPAGDSHGAGRRGGTAVHNDLAACTVEPGRAPRLAMTRQVLSLLQQVNWTVVQAEVPVAYGGFGTAADLLVRDSAGRRRIVEIKTGMDHAFTGHRLRQDHRLAAPLEAYASHPLHHTYLQCITTCLMFSNTYRDAVPFSVLLVNGAGARLYTPVQSVLIQDFTNAVRDWLEAEGRS